MTCTDGCRIWATGRLILLVVIRQVRHAAGSPVLECLDLRTEPSVTQRLSRTSCHASSIACWVNARA